MKCDECQRPINYCCYINDEHWLAATGGVKEGYLCAHCLLEKLGGAEWYLIWNEPAHRSSDGLDRLPPPSHIAP